jgi:hypothetical protein
MTIEEAVAYEDTEGLGKLGNLDTYLHSRFFADAVEVTLLHTMDGSDEIGNREIDFDMVSCRLCSSGSQEGEEGARKADKKESCKSQLVKPGRSSCTLGLEKIRDAGGTDRCSVKDEGGWE